MKSLHPLMLAGTGSDVGKSVIATALCRIFHQDGYSPAPFKAQNMALNSYVTADGLEIGRAQAVQAEAAGIPCEADMNPILLKPQSDHTSQVVLLGKPIGNKNAYDYWRHEGKDELRKEVHAAFDRLSQRFNPIVMEGAGSIAELNLRDTDLVNMPMARYADARVILVADIDRGGVFASAYGSIMLQDEEDRNRIKGIIVNKFRGDMRLFEDGRRMLEDVCGVPVLGVIPFMKDIHIEEEDSQNLTLSSPRERENLDNIPSLGGGRGRLTVLIIRLPYISNFTDFDALERDPRIELSYTDKADELKHADIIILPGTKSTLNDLRWLHQSGMAEAILRARREGKTILGICGGYQMMGQTIEDPNHVEGPVASMSGLGLLPIHTIMAQEKTTRQTTFKLRIDSSEVLKGYEIHMGRTNATEGEMQGLVQFEDGTTDGYFQDEHCMGTYIHGILDNRAFVDFLLRPFADRIGRHHETNDYQTYKQQQYDLLADRVRQYLDMDKLYSILTP